MYPDGSIQRVQLGSSHDISVRLDDRSSYASRPTFLEFKIMSSVSTRLDVGS